MTYSESCRLVKEKDTVDFKMRGSWSMALKFEHSQQTLDWFVLMFEAGRLNLNPAFQRRSVWSRADRRKLIESIYRGCPLPSIFLYARPDAKRIVYDVIDGK